MSDKSSSPANIAGTKVWEELFTRLYMHIWSMFFYCKKTWSYMATTQVYRDSIMTPL